MPSRFRVGGRIIKTSLAVILSIYKRIGEMHLVLQDEGKTAG